MWHMTVLVPERNHRQRKIIVMVTIMPLYYTTVHVNSSLSGRLVPVKSAYRFRFRTSRPSPYDEVEVKLSRRTNGGCLLLAYVDRVSHQASKTGHDERSSKS